ncbi:hypothetical protein [Bosea sp. LjRoot237]|uniref:hypothetical protein n=1 Tax=Bosea sp. LjRoot237 TaxID=3342292 RepID=UPI003ED011D0
MRLLALATLDLPTLRFLAAKVLRLGAARRSRWPLEALLRAATLARAWSQIVRRRSLGATARPVFRAADCGLRPCQS